MTRLRSAPTLVAVLLLALLTLGAPAAAQDDAKAPEDADARLAAWSQELDQAAQEVDSTLITDRRLEHWRERLPAIHDGAQEIATEAGAKAESVQTLLDALGPPPEEGTEPPAVAEQRYQLNSRLETYQGRVKQAELLVARTQELLKRLSGARRTRFAGRLLAPGPSPLEPATWGEAAVAFVDGLERTAHAFVNWFTEAPTAARWRSSVPVLAAALAVSVVIAWPLRRILLRRFGRDPRIAEPTYMRRLLAGAAEGLVHGLVPSLAAAAVYLGLWAQGLLEGLMRDIAVSTLLAIAFFALVMGLTRAAVAPESRTWRCIPFADESARGLERVLVALAAVFAVDLVLVQTGRALQVPEALGVAHNLIFGVIIAGLLLALLRPRLWLPQEADETTGAPAAKTPRLHPALATLLAAVALAVPGAALAGYYILSRFLAVRVVLTGVLIALLLSLHGLVRELVAAALDPESESGRRLSHSLALSEGGMRLVRFWLTAGIDVLLLLAGVVVALPLWGVGWADLSTWLYSALFGFKIGSVTFSLTDVLAAIAVFVLVWTATRFLQRVLEERVLPQTRLDVGVRHSLKAAVGYGGIVLAALMAISALGLDLSNLAIIAGALSVGIGFGLQAIVNNFVSGLILLVERPVKVGDWVVVGPHEGLVKRINVRATELETFDRAAVMVPNSELISTSVTNWTHKSRVCRIIVRIPAPYGCDTRQVHDILLRCAGDHPHVLDVPEPYVLFRGYGESALQFELRVYARDVDYFLTLESELYFAADEALRAAGLAAPFPQRVVHVQGTQAVAPGVAPDAARPRRAGDGGAGARDAPDAAGEGE